MRKLIEIHQEYSIVCDNKECDFKIKSFTGDPNQDISMYINVPCPMCGENLLTEDDYKLNMKILKAVKWMNRWFSWITFFNPRKSEKDSIYVHAHKGIKIEQIWEFGMCKDMKARRHRKDKNVQFIIWNKGEQGHLVDCWIDFDKYWWSDFTPDK